MSNKSDKLTEDAFNAIINEASSINKKLQEDQVKKQKEKNQALAKSMAKTVIKCASMDAGAGELNDEYRIGTYKLYNDLKNRQRCRQTSTHWITKTKAEYIKSYLSNYVPCDRVRINCTNDNSCHLFFDTKQVPKSS